MAGASCSDVVQLSRAERPWRPRHHRDLEEEGTDLEERQTQEIVGRVQSVLNKLTPEMFQRVMKEMGKIPIQSERHLRAVVEMVIKRAISEPKFSVALANMCCCFAGLKVPMEFKPHVTVNLRKLLLNRCQKEFERDLGDEILEKKNDELVTCSGEQQQCLRDTDIQQRMVGIVKFIGELFKVKMLTESIMHDCIAMMLKAHSEERLVCLCVLLSVIGKDLDIEKAKAKPCMDQYFNQINIIIKERQTSNRIRFMLQDVIDLRRANWVRRHGDPGPQTIANIRRQAMEEKMGTNRRPKRSVLEAFLNFQTLPVAAYQETETHTGFRLGQIPRFIPPALAVESSLQSRVAPLPAPTAVAPPPPAVAATPLAAATPAAAPPISAPLAAATPTAAPPPTAAASPPPTEAPPPPASPGAAAAIAPPTPAGVWCPPPLEDDLSCPVCCDIYTDPVVLPCSHSFCRPCLERSWRQDSVRQECLLCRQKTSTHNPTPNRALRDVCEAYLKERSAGTLRNESVVNISETHLVQALCPAHDEKLHFYCQDEDQLVCVECVTQEHKTHSVCSTKKAAQERKDELKCLIKSLEDDVKKNKTLLEGVMAHIKEQAAQTESQIKEEFEKLQQFLRREEEARIAALRQEERDKTSHLEEKMEAIERVISSLSERMKPIEKLMETDEVSFLQTFSETKERTQEAFLHPQPGFWLLLDVSKYLDKLSYRVWDRMKEMVAHSAVIVGSDTLQFHPVISAPDHLECFAAETSGIRDAGEVSGQARVDHISF